MPSDKEQLISMGFDEASVDKALSSTQYSGLQPALDWLLGGGNFGDTDVHNDVVANSDASINPPAEAMSLKCDDCGKLLSSDTAAQAHATKSGHTNFSESCEEVKPLTEEEKRVQLEMLQDKLKQKRVEREAQEAKDNLEREKARRKHGRDMIEAKSKFEENEIRRLAEIKKKEKEEDRLYRQKLREDIAKDRERKKISISSQASVQEVKSMSSIPQSVCTNYDTCNIQIRHSHGAPVISSFSANDSLFKVALLFSNKTGVCNEYEVEFRTNLPPKLYSKADMSKTLKELGFCPSIVLNAIIKKGPSS